MSIKARLAIIEQRAGRHSRNQFPPMLTVTDKVAQAGEIAEYEAKYGSMGLVLILNRPGER